MPKDKRIDTYINKSADFAQPILKHLRKLVHQGCPEVEETLKWGMPSFMYRGILCSMAAFKQHAVFGFWKHTLLIGTNPGSEGAMGSFGKLISVKDLPNDKVLLRLIRQATKLNETGVKITRSKPKIPLKVPLYFSAALKKNKKAEAAFKEFSYSHKKEYLEWITEAKTTETRNKRIATALEWMSEGKPRNWRYMRK